MIFDSFEDVENEKELNYALDEFGNQIEAGFNNSELATDEELKDYQRIANIYEAITKYREELRKLQGYQREDIR